MPLTPKSFIKKSLYAAFGFTSLNLLIQLSKQKLFQPFYHVVSNEDIPHIAPLYPIRNVATFENDLNFFAKNYTPLSAQKILEHVQKGKPFTQPSFHLSFDDGLKEMLTIVAPILYQKGIPATFFINSDFVDNKDLFYRYKVALLIASIKKQVPSKSLENILNKTFSQYGITQQVSIVQKLLSVQYHNKNVLKPLAEILEVDFSLYLKTKQPYLNTEDINQLIKMGFAIGSHSIDHPNYKQLSLAEQIHQTKISTEFTKNTFNLPYAYFSFPFSDEYVSMEFFDTVFDTKSPLVDLSFGISGLKRDYNPLHLHRFPMEGNQLSAERLVKSEYLYYIAKSLLHKNKILRQ